MYREIDEDQIRPDKWMNSKDMAKVGCRGCEGCGECCRDRAAAITLDAYDIKLMKEGLEAGFQDLLDSGAVRLAVIDGIVLPTLGKKADEDACIFQMDDGRCRIHAFRPGICRMFPLARIYHDDGTFSYFLQEGECPHGNGVKIRISKWLDYPNIREYEQAVTAYHGDLELLRKQCRESVTYEEQKILQKKFLLDHFIRG